MSLTYVMTIPANDILADGAFITDGKKMVGVGAGESVLSNNTRLAGVNEILAEGGDVSEAFAACMDNLSTHRIEGPYPMREPDIDKAVEMTQKFLDDLNTLMDRNPPKAGSDTSEGSA